MLEQCPTEGPNRCCEIVLGAGESQLCVPMTFNTHSSALLDHKTAQPIVDMLDQFMANLEEHAKTKMLAEHAQERDDLHHALGTSPIEPGKPRARL